MAYYDGTKLLSMRDINGNVPEIFICTTNRNGGKTTYFNRLMVNRFRKTGAKFMLIYRFNYELDNCADKFFKDINGLFFPGMTMTSKPMARGTYHELFLDDVSCGYAIALNSADQIKKLSHFFSDTSAMLFDEFQSENNHYCSDEVKKLMSVHTSVARGQGKQVRYVPVYMLSNAVTLLNPYYIEMGIAGRLNSSVNFLKGDGWVLESGFIESASEAQKQSGFNRAFAGSGYVQYAAENVYLNDSQSFIQKMPGNGRYICTLKYEDKLYSIKEYAEQGIIYCDDHADASFPTRITLTTEDHDINYVMLKRNDVMLGVLRDLFKKGCFRFKNLRCKAVILKALSI